MLVTNTSKCQIIKFNIYQILENLCQQSAQYKTKMTNY